MEPILYTRKDAAAVIGLSVRALDYFIKRGELRARRIGKRILVPRTELERFAAKDRAFIVPDTKDAE